VLAEELRAGDERLVEVRLAAGAQAPKWLTNVAAKNSKQREVTLRPNSAGTGHELVPEVNGEPRVRVDVTKDDLDWLTADGQVVVIWAAYLAEDRLGLQCHSFTAADLGRRMDVGVDDSVADQVRIAANATHAGFEPVSDWLVDEFALPPVPGEHTHRYVHSGGPTDDFSSGIRAFTLHGKRWVADVSLVEGQLRITRMTDVPTRGRGRWPRLSSITIRFVNRGEAADATEAIRAALLGLASDGRSYLDLWQAYNEIEREALLEDAKQLKWASYRSCQVLADGLWRFELQPGERAESFLGAVAGRTGLLEIEATRELPPELAGSRGRSTSGVHGEVRRVARGESTLDLALSGDEPPAPAGYLFRSLSGDRTRLRRRDVARERIETDQAELPGLRLLIEGLPRPGAKPVTNVRHDRIISSLTRRSPDASEPTGAQREALMLALRTPDLLLVQGPPGTGKTKFITDLLRCLDELGEKTVSMNRTLISSVQHDAVDNVARRARRLGLPPIRVSTRQERDREGIRQWRDETLAIIESYLENHRPEALHRDRAAKLTQLASAYDQRPVTGADLIATLDEARRLAGTDVSCGLRDEMDRLVARLQYTSKTDIALAADDKNRISRIIRSIRVTAVSFDDDGPNRASNALRGLAGLLDDTALTVLEKAADACEADAELLAELASTRSALLSRTADGTPLRHAATHDPEVNALLHELADEVAETFAGTPDSADDVLRAYRDDLKEDIALVESTLARYNAVLASTVQQANSMEMSRVLEAPHPVFDTVIVDEAARANPLDLMIPMAFARKRIILVGDHKQLPHVLEQKVERELRKNKSLDGSELSKSLFERWFDLFSGEKPAVRTIRLDTQFRMHPALGAFVSRVFYGSPDAVKAHPSTVELTHRLGHYAGKVAAWIEVGYEAGGDVQKGFSRVREAEAKRLAAELAELALLDSERELTFGVITFYRSQQELLESALIDIGLGVLNDDTGAFEPVPAMALTRGPRPRQRLRIGTVDAFQGMEFDVVLLSVTRSSPQPLAASDTRDAVRRYGHLLSDSRMCVAMSRQRRLLIAVGDVAMAERSAIPEVPGTPGRSVAEGLVAFREFCEGEHGAGIRS
jgi:AAA domain